MRECSMRRRQFFDHRFAGEAGLLSIELAAAMAGVALVVALLALACAWSDGLGGL